MPEFIGVELKSDFSSDSEWLHLFAYWAKSRFYYRTNFPWLFWVFRSPFEVEFYSGPLPYYRTNFARLFYVFRYSAASYRKLGL